MTTALKFLHRCNGYTLGAFKKALNDTKASFLAALGPAREEFRAYAQADSGPGGQYEFGTRFNDDESVWERAVSAGTQEEIAADPRAWALDALRDCASADHWYTYEKEW